FLTDIVRRPVFFRVELVLARDDEVFERDVEVFRERAVPVVLREELLLLAFRAVVVPDFLRDDVPPPRDEEDDLRVEPLRPEDDRDDDEDEDDDFVSPACERCLLTVRAAISFARFVDRPCFFSESLMCSYCRSRLALHASGMCVRPPGWFPGRPTHARNVRGLFVHACATTIGFDVGASTPPARSTVTITREPRDTRTGSVKVRPSNWPARCTCGFAIHASYVFPCGGAGSATASTAVPDGATTSSPFAPRTAT